MNAPLPPSDPSPASPSPPSSDEPPPLPASEPSASSSAPASRSDTNSISASAADQPPSVSPDPADRSTVTGWLQSELAIGAGRAPDRWRHRRGEPRLFAFLWTVYLLIATTLALASIATAGIISADVYFPIARTLAIVVTVGVIIAWPLIRLSQLAPQNAPRPQHRHPALATLLDVLVMVLPTVAVLWPQTWLAFWAPGVVLVILLDLFAWALIIGALLAFTLRRAGAREARLSAPATLLRSSAMLTIIALALTGPLLALFAAATSPTAPPLLPAVAPPDASPYLLASPVGFVLDAAANRAWSGRAALDQPIHWAAATYTLAVGIALWLIPGLTWTLTPLPHPPTHPPPRP